MFSRWAVWRGLAAHPNPGRRTSGLFHEGRPMGRHGCKMISKENRILIAGLGKSGLSALRYLSSRKFDVAGYDLKLDEERRSSLAKEFPLLYFYSGELKDVLHQESFDVIVLSPGISAKLPELGAFREKGKKVVGDVDVLLEKIHGRKDKIIGITGSNGKSTVTKLTGHLLASMGKDIEVAGNIGNPVLEAFERRGEKSCDAWVLELSSFQMETIDNLGAHAACCLNISEDHLNRHESMVEYAYEKSKIFRSVDIQVLNWDDPVCRLMKKSDCKVRWFSLKEEKDAWFDGENLIVDGEKIMRADELPIVGAHNVANVLASFLLCESMGFKAKDLAAHVKTFQGLPHRLEKVGEKSGVLFLDDSKGTNVGATEAALKGATAPVVLIAGGDGKGQDFSPLLPAARGKVRKVFLIGRDGPLIGKVMGDEIPTQSCDTLEDAVKEAYLFARRGDWLMLSPACASWDMFSSYVERSEVFVRAFESLKEIEK